MPPPEWLKLKILKIARVNKDMENYKWHRHFGKFFGGTY